MENFNNDIFTAFQNLGVAKWHLAKLAGYKDYSLSRLLRDDFEQWDFATRMKFYIAFELADRNKGNIADFVAIEAEQLQAERTKQRSAVKAEIDSNGEDNYRNKWHEWALSNL